MKNNNIDEMIGKTFNRLIVLKYSHKDKWRDKYYLCKCTNDNNLILVKGSSLRNGKTKSCGCLQKEIVSFFAKENNYKKAKNNIEDYSNKINYFKIDQKYDLSICFFIYKITNLINNKIYIGQSTVSLKNKLKSYLKSGKTEIYKEIEIFGLHNFLFEILDFCTMENIDEKEIYYIKFFNSNNDNIGYNHTNGGKGIVGLEFTEDHKKNISKAMKGKFIGENNPFYGKKHSLETIEKIIESNKRRSKNG